MTDPTTETALRDRIAEALYAHNHPGWATRYTDLDQDERDTYLGRAAAVLAVLPDPAAVRARTLAEAADWLEAWRPEFFERWAVAERDRYEGGVDDAATELRRLTGETPADTAAQAVSCAHCGNTIRRITGTLTAWWVHIPGGQAMCQPWKPARSTRATPKPAAGAQQETEADRNSGPGWYEVINPRNATTNIALVHEDGSLYLPEGPDALTEDEFAFAAARGNAHRLVRADDREAK